MTTITDLLADTTLDWHADAACIGLNPALWFPSRGEDTAVAKAVCATCPVRDECLEWALDNAERWGVWGGKSTRERRRIMRDRRSAA